MTTHQQAPPRRQTRDLERLTKTNMAHRGLTVRECLIAWAALAVLGALVFAPHVRHGGFYLDDWSNAAGVLRPPGGPGLANALAFSWNLTLYRPVLVLYLPATYLTLGTHMAYQLAWAASLTILAGAMLYGVLRTLGVPRVHTWIIAALTIVYPWSDSTRLWVTGSLLTLAVVFAFAGLWLALEGLHRRSWRLHACAAVLYLLSIWTYEVALPMIALAGALYTVVAGWQVAKIRWAVDLMVVLVAAAWVGLNTTQESFGVSADLRHLKQIIISGGTILGRTLIPFGEQRTTTALVLLLVVVGAGLAMSILGKRQPRSMAITWTLRSWLFLLGGGLLMAVLGWIMFIPANPYFTPTVFGVTNRVNVLSAFGAVVAIYAALGVVGELVAGWTPRAWRLSITVTLLLASGLGVAFTEVLERHIKIWNAAYQAERAGIGEMRMRFPRLPAGSTLFTSDYPSYETLGVPIFSAGWDVNGMIKLQYKDGSLSAYPVLPGLHLVCGMRGIWLAGIGSPTPTASYGAARFLNVHTGEHVEPLSREECQRLAGRYTPGPLYVSLTY